MTRETFYSVQTTAISRITCWERVLCFLDHLTEDARCSKGHVWDRPFALTVGAKRQSRRPGIALSRVCREATRQQVSRAACADFSETHLLMLAAKTFELEPRPRRVSSCITPRLPREEYRLRLKRFPPIRQADGSHLNPRPRSALLRFRLFASCSNENSRFRFGKRNCASLTFSLLNGIQRFRERRGGEEQWLEPRRRQPFG
jgi:hypothetical protein